MSGSEGHIADVGGPSGGHEPGTRVRVVDHGHLGHPTETTYTKQSDGSWKEAGNGSSSQESQQGSSDSSGSSK